jgi:hypothetical protein
MSLKDKLEIGLKPDAPFRRDNLPEFQQDDEDCKQGATPGQSPEVEQARADCEKSPDTEKGEPLKDARKRKPVRAQR